VPSWNIAETRTANMGLSKRLSFFPVRNDSKKKREPVGQLTSGESKKDDYYWVTVIGSSCTFSSSSSTFKSCFSSNLFFILCSS
jgi:hypothetical protein